MSICWLGEQCRIFIHDASGRDETRGNATSAHSNAVALLDVFNNFFRRVYVDVVLAKTGLGDDVSSVALAVRGEDKTSSLASVSDDLDFIDFHRKLLKVTRIGVGHDVKRCAWLIGTEFGF